MGSYLVSRTQPVLDLGYPGQQTEELAEGSLCIHPHLCRYVLQRLVKLRSVWLWNRVTRLIKALFAVNVPRWRPFAISPSASPADIGCWFYVGILDIVSLHAPSTTIREFNIEFSSPINPVCVPRPMSANDLDRSAVCNIRTGNPTTNSPSFDSWLDNRRSNRHSRRLKGSG